MCSYINILIAMFCKNHHWYLRRSIDIWEISTGPLYGILLLDRSAYVYTLDPVLNTATVDFQVPAWNSDHYFPLLQWLRAPNIYTWYVSFRFSTMFRLIGSAGVFQLWLRLFPSWASSECGSNLAIAWASETRNHSSLDDSNDVLTKNWKT